MDKYIGLDVHSKSCTAAIVDARGKRLGTHVVETSATALVDFLKNQRGTLRVCMEEGTQSLWLTEILTPHVQELAVKAVGKTHSRGPKSDAHDAFDLAEMLRTNAVGRRVFKGIGPFARLRSLVKAHRAVVQDVTRVKCRMKALYRARAIKTDGKQIYAKKAREMYLAELPESERTAAMSLNAQLDALCTVRDAIEKQLTEESHTHAAAKVLESCPGIGEIRAAQILATVVTPERFRRRQLFWSYCGLGIVMRSSSDWIQGPSGKWTFAPVQATRGLNKNSNMLLKSVFKGAATTILMQHRESRLFKDYERMLAAGTKPNLAKLTLARKVASITLALWKRKEVYSEKTNQTQPT